MQFTDVVFGLFMGLFFCVYWFLLRSNLRWQNVWLLSASYVFYGWWDWRFLCLIIITSASSYLTAILYARNKRKWLITLNIVLNLGILVAFKYFNFFSENIVRLFNLFGLGLDWFTLDVLLPVGISFYTFQAIGYSVDVLRGKVLPTRDIIGFFSFIAFFPQLVAGPIESASTLLPQMLKKREWNEQRAVVGLRMVLFGLLKKVCVADMLAIYVDRIFDSPEMSPLYVLIGGVMFSIQLYCDFSAYSEIARGCASMLGFRLMVNFRFPYLSRNILEFWQRWHISLMLWFKDYLYIPLGGNRKGKARTMFNYSLVFLLSGLWHGASWNFVIWGLYWALCYIIGRSLFHLNRHTDDLISIRCLPEIVATFGFVSFGFYLFRCTDINMLFSGVRYVWVYILSFGAFWAFAKMLSPLLIRMKVNGSLFCILSCLVVLGVLVVVGKWVYLLKAWWIVAALIVVLIEWHDRNGDYPFYRIPGNPVVRWGLYWCMGTLIILSEPTDMTFIYFQF